MPDIDRANGCLTKNDLTWDELCGKITNAWFQSN
jgi:hypothetical protein